MGRFLLVRFSHFIITMFVVSLLAFGLSRLAGNPVDALLPLDATPQMIAHTMEQWGLNEPLHVQYYLFISNALQGDFGHSLLYDRPAFEVVMSRLPATIELGLSAIALSVILAIPLGVIAAKHKGTAIDGGVNIFALLGQSMPIFWLGIILIWIFSVNLGWFASAGYGGWQHLILPTVSFAWYQVAAMSRLTRSAMVEALDGEYVKLARIKGVPEWKIVWKHSLRNAAVVPLTYFGILAGIILTGSVVIEEVFAWPGVGRLALNAIRRNDFAVIQTIVMAFAFLYVVLNLVVDMLYALVDPRIRNN